MIQREYWNVELYFFWKFSDYYTLYRYFHDSFSEELASIIQLVVVPLAPFLHTTYLYAVVKYPEPLGCGIHFPPMVFPPNPISRPSNSVLTNSHQSPFTDSRSCSIWVSVSCDVVLLKKTHSSFCNHTSLPMLISHLQFLR